ncbi:choice-of-anchor V domain-containing protein [Candidatus Chrysopegis kryptomonas]|uniref:Reelin domain-containing protein n=1 Tax=Candidatus Chryseopegocella kryptomonas TaxID=1633643 RepID=A0A0P1MNQ4_9BACT|nr:choice-of-anchor V domain-containing protein [Candidatus Chrysopegis kryptomonas]CUS96710.1 hypothetical protein JGI23_00169 [Candidatus Chrysopegis kryptomonas]
MRKILNLLFMLCVIGLFILSFSNQEIRSHSNGAPSLECDECHSGAENEEVKILISGLPDNYIPNKRYEIKLKIESGLISEGEYQGGFGLTVSGGKVVVIDRKNTQVSEGYLTHTVDGSRLREWKFGWIAPASGEVEFSIMGVAANGDYSPSGDAIGVETVKIKPIEKRGKNKGGKVI